MDVEIDDRDAFGAVRLLRMAGGDRGIVEQAKPIAAVMLGVMAGRAARDEDIVGLTGEDVVDPAIAPPMPVSAAFRLSGLAWVSASICRTPSSGIIRMTLRRRTPDAPACLHPRWPSAPRADRGALKFSCSSKRVKRPQPVCPLGWPGGT